MIFQVHGYCWWPHPSVILALWWTSWNLSLCSPEHCSICQIFTSLMAHSRTLYSKATDFFLLNSHCDPLSWLWVSQKLKQFFFSQDAMPGTNSTGFFSKIDTNTCSNQVPRCLLLHSPLTLLIWIISLYSLQIALAGSWRNSLAVDSPCCSSVASPHMVAHTSLELWFEGTWYLLLTSQTLNTSRAHTHMQASTQTHKIKVNP